MPEGEAMPTRQRRVPNESALQGTTVLVVGTIARDRCLVVERIPGPNADAFVLVEKSFPGGAAANVGAMLSLLGARVRILARIGPDVAGRALLSDLRSYGLDTRLVLSGRGSTARFVVLMDESGNRSCLLPRRSSAFALDVGDLARIKGWDFRVVCVVGAPLAVTQAALTRARLMGSITALALGFLITTGADERALRRLTPLVDMAFLNRAELMSLSPRMQSALVDEKRKWPRMLVVTDGAAAATYYGQEGQVSIAPGRQVPAIMTLGCGDAFMAGCVAGLALGVGTAYLLQLGHACAESVATRLDARPLRGDAERLRHLLRPGQRAS